MRSLPLQPVDSQDGGMNGRPELPTDFENFYREHRPYVTRLLVHRGLTALEAEDALQEAFIEVLRRWDQIRVPAAYVLTAAFNYGVRHRLRSKNAPVPGPDDLTESEDSPEDRILEQIDLKKMIRRLPPTQAVTIALVMDGYNSADISKLLNVPPATVRSNLRHARQHLLALLATDAP